MSQLWAKFVINLEEYLILFGLYSRRRDFDSQLFERFRKDASGGVLIYFGFILSIILGVTGLSVDVSYWYILKRSRQAAAYIAALTGILDVNRGGDDSQVTSTAEMAAAENGFDAIRTTPARSIPPTHPGAVRRVRGRVLEIIQQRTANVRLWL